MMATRLAGFLKVSSSRCLAGRLDSLSGLTRISLGLHCLQPQCLSALQLKPSRCTSSTSPRQITVFHNPTMKYILTTQASAFASILGIAGIVSFRYMDIINIVSQSETDEIVTASLLGALILLMYGIMNRILLLAVKSIKFSEESGKFTLLKYNSFLLKKTVEFAPGEAVKLASGTAYLLAKNVSIKGKEYTLAGEHIVSVPFYRYMFDANVANEK